jgi:hypothetical protein
MEIGIQIPPPMLVKRALTETIEALRRRDEAVRNNVVSSLKVELENSHARYHRAMECLRTRCAAGYLQMFVIDPDTGMRHGLPAEYFDRPSSTSVFGGAEGRLDLSNLENDDPIKVVLRFANGWAAGFVDSQFQEWLADQKSGPLAGPAIRPFFGLDSAENASPREPPVDVADESEGGQAIEPTVGERAQAESISGHAVCPDIQTKDAKVGEEAGTPSKLLKPSNDEKGKEIDRILGAARSLYGVPSEGLKWTKTPGKMAIGINAKRKTYGITLGHEAIKKVLGGSYPTMVARGIKSPYAGNIT